MKLDDFKKFGVKKAQMASLIGGTSTTLYKTIGVIQEEPEQCENEYEDTNGNGSLDDEESKGPAKQMGCG